MKGRPLNVLLIEDDPADVRLIHEMLCGISRQNINLESRNCLTASLEYLANNSVDLVLLDLGLPDSQGLDTLKRLQAHPPKVPVIILTNPADEQIASEAVNSVVQDYISKSELDGRLLARAIEYALERWQMGQALHDMEAKHRHLYNNAQVGLYRCRIEDGKILECNNFFAELVGYENSEKCLADYVWWEHYVNADFRNQMLKDMQKKGEASNLETQITCCDGSPVWISTSARIYPEEGYMEGSVINITERKMAEAKEHETATLKELNQLRSDLLANVSHELRTPLTSIKGYATMLLDYDKKLKVEEKRRYLVSIDQSTTKLAELISQLLDMSRLESGTLSIEKEPTNIIKLIREAVAGIQVGLNSHPLLLKLSKKAPRLYIDPGRIRQVLESIIDNAVKFSAPGTEVTISARRAGKELMISIADQGPGIPADELPKVFERMYSGKQVRSKTTSGIGLGLPISKAIVELHGGSIWISSKPRKGSTCFFTLPLSTDTGDINEKRV